MPDKHLHIISFDIPFPPNYGGIIDVYYKLKSLHKAGIKIHLHCFKYNRATSSELNEFCEKVNYYDRHTSMLSAFSGKPYIVSSRRSDDLINNLLKDEHPILFEGLHTCYYIDDIRLKNRVKIYRESNIEHLYYYNLFKVEINLVKKIYFLLASLKLRLYEKVVKNSSLMLVVSQKDTEYLQNRYIDNRVYYLPSFHKNENVQSLTGKGDYVLYHGNLSVAENYKAAEFLINEVFNDSEVPLIIAGLNPPNHLKKLIESYPRVKLVENPPEEQMFELIHNAHIHILITFQATGLKLKLLNTLYNGRHVIVNEAMLNGTSLENLCIVANQANELKEKIKSYGEISFSSKDIKLRNESLKHLYSNDINTAKLIEYVFGGA